MADEITPETVSIHAQAEFENAEALEERLRQLRKLDAGDDFDEQIFDFSDDTAFLAFQNKPREESYQESLILTPANQEPPETEGGEDVLSIRANFSYESIGVFQQAFAEMLSRIDSIEVDHLALSFSLDREFESLDPLRPIFDATEHDINGIRFRQAGFEYIFQDDDGETDVMALSREEFPATSGEFIREELERASPAIQDTAHDPESG